MTVISKQSAVVVMALVLSACQAPMARHTQQDWAPTEPPKPQPALAQPGAIFQTGHSRNWFLDQRARQVGDTVSVILMERTDASKQAGTNTSKGSSVTVPIGTLLGSELPIDTSISGSTKFDGKGSSSQSNRLTGSITVTVSEVLANGNLKVRGEKWVTINQGEEFIRLAGTIRAEDINGDNSIPSFKVADARIIYSGRGAVADSNKMGWLARFFNSGFWPL